jgi:hypothetical protein
VVTVRKPALHVHAVAGEEHAEALDHRALTDSGLRRECFEERQAHHDPTEPLQEPATTG